MSSDSVSEYRRARSSSDVEALHERAPVERLRERIGERQHLEALVVRARALHRLRALDRAHRRLHHVVREVDIAHLERRLALERAQEHDARLDPVDAERQRDHRAHLHDRCARSSTPRAPRCRAGSSPRPPRAPAPTVSSAARISG